MCKVKWKEKISKKKEKEGKEIKQESRDYASHYIGIPWVNSHLCSRMGSRISINPGAITILSTSTPHDSIQILHRITLREWLLGKDRSEEE